MKVVLNPLTGLFDAAPIFDPNRIVTHEYNVSGNLLKIYDPAVGDYVELGALIVTDNEGNVVTV